jgi:MoxR-like ATPase
MFSYYLKSMFTVILFALLCVAILGVVIYIFVLDDRKSLTDWLKKDKKTEIWPHSTKGSLFEVGLWHVRFHQAELRAVYDEIHKKIIGMEHFINAIILNMLCDGHMLIEGVPGLAKTKTIHTFADIMGMDFKRIQFTPDMLPADIVGVEIYDNEKKHFEAKIWPIMANIILADEINRATPKVQSALLESMQERQVTIWGKTFKLPEPFFVLATQNPLEQEGTYPLPEAQIDRFLFKILVKYPSVHDEKKILDEMEHDESIQVKKVLSHEEFLHIKKNISQVTISDQVKSYITRLVDATRNCEQLSYGASPRGSIGLMTASKALAFCEGRDYVTHDDVQRVSLPVLRHRVVMSYEAKMEGLEVDTILIELFEMISLS